MSEDSEWWEYWKKRIKEKEIQELKEQVAELEREVEILDAPDYSEETEAETEEYTE
jgi:hypothetical protein